MEIISRNAPGDTAYPRSGMSGAANAAAAVDGNVGTIVHSLSVPEYVSDCYTTCCKLANGISRRRLTLFNPHVPRSCMQLVVGLLGFRRCYQARRLGLRASSLAHPRLLAVLVRCLATRAWWLVHERRCVHSGLHTWLPTLNGCPAPRSCSNRDSGMAISITNDTSLTTASSSGAQCGSLPTEFGSPDSWYGVDCGPRLGRYVWLRSVEQTYVACCATTAGGVRAHIVAKCYSPHPTVCTTLRHERRAGHSEFVHMDRALKRASPKITCSLERLWCGPRAAPHSPTS
ncbi:hypothetical protein EON66_02170 [archaeon]|nr:MAG: hypothetical protein EON66_02170 [archaeon]